MYSIPIERDVANVTIQGSGSATVIGENSTVSVEVGGVREDVLASATSNGSLSFEETYRNLSPTNGSDQLTFRIETTGLAGARLDGVTIWKDTDGDGYTDRRERIGFETANFGRITTDPYANDTDGEGLDDGEEVGELVSESGRIKLGGRSQSYQFEYYRLHSHPRAQDSDHDGLNDSVETNGWNVTVVDRRHQEMYRWNSTQRLAPGESRDEVHFSSDPLDLDTDNDGLTDSIERNVTHTDPESKVTYNITAEHQREIMSLADDLREERTEDCLRDSVCINNLRADLRPIGFISDSPHTPDTVQEFEEWRLTDRTDDADFVTPDGYQNGPEDLRRFGFTALDGEERTDVWLPNGQEVWERVDPWDPDTDDDGLTDGQELRGMTFVSEELYERGVAAVAGQLGDYPRTDPNDPDTDGDGWWDGWFGVYGVGYSDNVILYMHNARDGDGIRGNETVPEQAGIHNVSQAPMARGVNRNGTRVHSNIHIGEYHWNTNPVLKQDNASRMTSLRVEVDYMAGHDPTRYTGPNGQDPLESTESNLRMYGLNITYIKDDRLTESNLESICTRGQPPVCLDYISAGSFNRHELDSVEDEYHDISRVETPDGPVETEIPTTLHLFWGPRLGEDSPGTAVDHAYELFGVDYSSATGMAFNNGAPGTEVWEDRTNNDFGLFIADERVQGHEDGHSVLMHEIGHALGVGYADDDPIAYAPLVGGVVDRGLEAYSGDVQGSAIGVDETPEELQSGGTVDWSIMGLSSGKDFAGTNQTRYAYSIEELSTMDFDDIPSAAGR